MHSPLDCCPPVAHLLPAGPCASRRIRAEPRVQRRLLGRQCRRCFRFAGRALLTCPHLWASVLVGPFRLAEPGPPDSPARNGQTPVSAMSDVSVFLFPFWEALRAVSNADIPHRLVRSYWR